MYKLLLDAPCHGRTPWNVEQLLLMLGLLARLIADHPLALRWWARGVWPLMLANAAEASAWVRSGQIP
jgi:hypothetical protein